MIFLVIARLFFFVIVLFVVAAFLLVLVAGVRLRSLFLQPLPKKRPAPPMQDGNVIEGEYTVLGEPDKK